MSERRPGSKDGGGPAGCLVLVGCGKMGTAMLRGWVPVHVVAAAVAFVLLVVHVVCVLGLR